MASTIDGGCLCGGVRYRLHGRPKPGSDCHCEDCRRASAAPYVTWCTVPSKAIEVLSGELRRVSYADRLRSFAFCCGTPLFIQDEASSEWIDVTVASLDDPKTFPPEVAIWTEDKLPWVKLDPSRRAFPGAEIKTPNQARRPTAQTASVSWMSSVASVLSGAATCMRLSRG